MDDSFPFDIETTYQKARRELKAEKVHKPHFLDGYPLCYVEGRPAMAPFKMAEKDTDVTCYTCKVMIALEHR